MIKLIIDFLKKLFADKRTGKIVEAIKDVSKSTTQSATGITKLIFPINPKHAKITSPYGWRILNGKKQYHSGLDIVFAGDKDLQVRAIAEGVVTVDQDKYDPASRYKLNSPSSGGRFITIKHKIHGKYYYCRYLHFSENFVSVGDRISQGKLIGMYSDFGFAFGKHLHFDMYDMNWKIVDPTQILKTGLGANGITVKGL